MLTAIPAARDFINSTWARTLADATRPDIPLGRMRIMAEQAAKNLPPWPEHEVAFDSRAADATAHYEILMFAESATKLARLILTAAVEMPSHVTAYALALVAASAELVIAEIGGDDVVTSECRG
jgi:hypothetical protein